MNEAKFKSIFLSFFFFFQGVFLTGMILFLIYNNKVVPVIKKKDTEIELLINELNKTKIRNHNHSGDDSITPPKRPKYKYIVI